jgi:hypothetical protein
MMQKRSHFRYAKRDGLTGIALPSSGSELEFVILLPNN